MKDRTLKKILVIGSGPIVIGQAAEFDYAGVQACRALKEENIEIVLVNSNPATIMTDEEIANKVYIEPLNLESLTEIIKKERPQGLIASLGGQTALNLACELFEAGVLDKYKVKLLGTNIDSIKKAEDREMFKNLMQEIGEPVPESEIVSSYNEASEFAKRIGFPIIIRPAFTLGGAGGGIARNERDYEEIVHQGLSQSPINQVLVEKSIAGYKEIEFEVIRDSNDTCITICSMENIDPIGIHTGDSFVVAPSQTLTANEAGMLRASAIRIIKALKIEGGCNVQFALDTVTNQYYIIEVNPRVSRSSALASKATGYPIAKITTKIAIGYNLNEIKNPITGKTAAFEPTIDYIVTKIPKWPFDKFSTGDRILGTKMKATGEIMAIGRTFVSSFKKAITSLEDRYTGLLWRGFQEMSNEELLTELYIQDDRRIFRLAQALYNGNEINKLCAITKIDKWFISKIKEIVDLERELSTTKQLDKKLYQKAKEYGFLDDEVMHLTQNTIETLKNFNVQPGFRLVDTCANEFSASTPYFYSAYAEADEVEDYKIKSQESYKKPKENILVLGSGPIRIGQGIEFDYCSVHASQELIKRGYESVMVNSNPETLSTDFDIATRLYFEPMNIEYIMNIIRKENPKGVLVQFGGQTAINLAEKLDQEGIKILGTSLESINAVEDRKVFEKLLKELNISQPKGCAVTSTPQALNAVKELGYPVLVRPSYVIGGRGMQVVYNDEELLTYITEAFKFSNEHPVLIDQYLEGQEVELDAISDGRDILIPGICEHIERAGVHSGDSMSIYPSQNISRKNEKILVKYATKIARKLNIKGLMNIQFIIKDDKVYVIEVNPRASRTVPIMSKVTGIPMVKIALSAILGKSIRRAGFGVGLYKKSNLVSVKMPIFSWQKLNRIDPALAPEMKSTGEVLGIDTSYKKALYKAFLAGGHKFSKAKQRVLVSLNDHNKKPALPVIKKLFKQGFFIMATWGTHKFLEKNGIPSKMIEKFMIDKLQKRMKNGRLSFIINTPTTGKNSQNAGFQIRTIAQMYGIPSFTSIDTANAFLVAHKVFDKNTELTYDTITNYRKKNFLELFK
ncbi:MAG: carbamoyl-phosphate synthase (glutamine-hydrolyzing) large subunit [Candidatus Gastranaerophilales bacterium]|nr:carbamoyl-phosphate synthase (glutamine-hydrolyzing) large subunit [Candidatus Gastranaerophilales bacterium]